MTPRLTGLARLTRFAATVGTFAVVASVPSTHPARADDVRVLAGSGLAGAEDGDAAHASFFLPTGLSVDRAGRVLVADTGGQRIRAVAPDGSVTTLAGGGDVESSGILVRGAYADGPAASARFSQPMKALELPDGAIAIADAQNHTIRLLDHGVVSTLAGAADRYADADGKGAAASFHFPRGLALDRQGTLYVADFGSGVRRVTRDGTVTSLPVSPFVGRDVVDVAISVVDGREELIETNGRRSDALGLNDGGRLLAWSADAREESPRGIGAAYEGDDLRPPYPTALATYSTSETEPTDYLATDAIHDAVWFVSHRFAGEMPAHAPTTALLEPLGVAILPNGRVVVADSGHRRLVTLPGPDRRSYVDPLRLPSRSDDGHRRIMLIGNSFVDAGVWYDRSPAGLLGPLLSRPGAPVDVLAVRVGDPRALASALTETAGAGLVDGVVVLVDDQTLVTGYGVPGYTNLADSAARWRAPFVRDLRSAVRIVTSHHVPIALVAMPTSAALGPVEHLAGYQLLGAGADAATDWSRSIAALAGAVAKAGATCTIDVGPAFVRAERHDATGRLFGSYDLHLAEPGDRLLAETTARGLATCAGWRRAFSSAAAHP